MVKAAILGYGTVGSGVAENQDLIAKRAGNPIERNIFWIEGLPGDPKSYMGILSERKRTGI